MPLDILVRAEERASDAIVSLLGIRRKSTPRVGHHQGPAKYQAFRASARRGQCGGTRAIPFPEPLVAYSGKLCFAPDWGATSDEVSHDSKQGILHDGPGLRLGNSLWDLAAYGDVSCPLGDWNVVAFKKSIQSN